MSELRAQSGEKLLVDVVEAAVAENHDHVFWPEHRNDSVDDCVRILLVEGGTAWASQLMQIKRMHSWVLEVEHILDGSWAQKGEEVSNAMVGSRLDTWREQMAKLLIEGSLSDLEQECLTQFLQEFTNLRSHLVQCYDREAFPRTNNDMERSIRGLKTRYRRISGRKNWNAYLLRYGRYVAYAAWWEQDAAHRQYLEQRTARLDRTRWRELYRSQCILDP